jgi:hypothetical protein
MRKNYLFSTWNNRKLSTRVEKAKSHDKTIKRSTLGVEIAIQQVDKRRGGSTASRCLGNA